MLNGSDSMHELESGLKKGSKLDLNEGSIANCLPSFVLGSPKAAECSYIRRINPDFSKETHYVIVVHGTFDCPPKPPCDTPWYWRDDHRADNFCQVLASQLRDSALGYNAIWREIPSLSAHGHGHNTMKTKKSKKFKYPFYWDGSNTHEGREDAGKSLASLLMHITRADHSARIHLVAHSHGGNVLLKSISKYLKLLREQFMAGDFYNEDIRKEFLTTHEEGYRKCAEWRAPNVSPLFWPLAPFLVVLQPLEGEPELGGFYYGYWKSTDALFGLPRKRQEKYLRKKWSTCPSTNALGHLVFMGTPFFSKFWLKGAWLAVATRVLISTAVFAGVSFILFVAPFGIYQNSLMAFYVVPTYVWVLITVLPFSVVMYKTFKDRRLHSGNLYYTEVLQWSRTMKALVLNAGKLDEAALALSTEPLVRAYLFPQIKAMLTPNLFSSFKRIPLDEGPKKFLGALWGNVEESLTLPIFIPELLVVYLLSFLLVPIFSALTLSLLITIGFGLQKGELTDAKVYVDEFLRLDPESHSVTHWNVQKVLTSAVKGEVEEAMGENTTLTKHLSELEQRLAPAEAVKREEAAARRWRFLWDEDELEEKARQCATLASLKDQINLLEHDPRINRDYFEKELKRICIVLEERFKDLSGSVELSHGSYFRNMIVISGIVQFLVHGELPPWASKLGDIRTPPVRKEGED